MPGALNKCFSIKPCCWEIMGKNLSFLQKNPNMETYGGEWLLPTWQVAQELLGTLKEGNQEEARGLVVDNNLGSGWFHKGFIMVFRSKCEAKTSGFVVKRAELYTKWYDSIMVCISKTCRDSVYLVNHFQMPNRNQPALIAQLSCISCKFSIPKSRWFVKVRTVWNYIYNSYLKKKKIYIYIYIYIQWNMYIYIYLYSYIQIVYM